MGHTGWSHGLLVRAHPWRAHVGRGRRWRRAPLVSVTSTQQGHRVPATLVRQRSRDRVACLASVSRTQPVPVTRRQGPSACARPAPVRQGWSTPRCVLDRPTPQIPVVQCAVAVGITLPVAVGRTVQKHRGEPGHTRGGYTVVSQISIRRTSQPTVADSQTHKITTKTQKPARPRRGSLDRCTGIPPRCF